MFEVGVTNIEDARPDSNNSRLNTISIYFTVYRYREIVYIITRG